MSRGLERYAPIPWEQLREQAAVLAKSAFVPADYRDKPDDVLAAGLYGQEIGLGLSTALSYIHVIKGKPTLSAEGMVALVRSRGHSIAGAVGPTVADVGGKRSDTGDQMTVQWTLDMARRAGLTGNDNWKKFPESMLWARAVSQLCRMLFPDVLLGLSYTPEEAIDMEPVEVVSQVTVNAPEATTDTPPPPLKKISQAAPKGTVDLYVDTETGEKRVGQEADDENERRRLNAERYGLVRCLSVPEAAAYKDFRAAAGIDLDKPGGEYTLEEARKCAAYLETVVERPF